MSIIKIENITHTNGGKDLYKNASLFINRNEHIALVGVNGAGKTTLLNIISKVITPDHGQVEVSPKLKLGYLDQHQIVDNNQTVKSYLQSNYADLFAKESEIERLYQLISVNYEEELLLRALQLQKDLDYAGFNLIDQKINKLIDGLGIDRNLLNEKIGSLSGGQKGKVILAKLFLSNSDFLLLDEPTNFLDINQVNWLAKFLKNYEGGFLLVSHDRNFINLTSNVIYDIDNYVFTRYVGNYEQFVDQKALANEQYDKAYQGQQKVIKKLETFIAKNAARASTAKLAQSRKKQLNKLDVMEQKSPPLIPKFSFPYKAPKSAICISAEKLEIGYAMPLLSPLTFKIKFGEKCLIKGHNGIGKTTFLKTLSGELKPLSGTYKLGDNTIVNYFQQVSPLPEFTPITYLHNLFPELEEKQIRSTLAKFAIRNYLMNQPLTSLSGGEQTKVRLAHLSLIPSNLLILDEPTNHIDTLAKDALLQAIQSFPGTVIMTTHDLNFGLSWIDNELNFEKLMI